MMDLPVNTVHFSVSGGDSVGLHGDMRARVADDEHQADAVRRSIDRRLTGGRRTVTWRQDGRSPTTAIYQTTIGHPVRRGGGFGAGGFAVDAEMRVYINLP